MASPVSIELDSDNSNIKFNTTDTNSNTLTERVRINNNGSIGIGGANYGTSGQVLTSNDSGSSVSWNTPFTPYYFRAEKSAQQSTTTVATPIDCTDWVASLPSPYHGNNNDLNNNGIEWQCPANGVYTVNCRLNMYNGISGQDSLREAIIRLHKKPVVSSNYSIVAENVIVISVLDATDIVTASPQFTDLIPMTIGDKLKISFAYKTTNPGTQLIVFNGPTSVWTITSLKL